MEGCLIIDKPEGISSANALNILKKFVRPAKIGHAGTLDPFASGVLFIAIGQATRLLEYIVAANKAYRFVIEWGSSTDTLDRTGNIISTSNHVVRLENIQCLVNQLPKKKYIKQIPPNYSAIHINGRRAYDMARSGLEFTIAPRDVLLNSLQILSHDNNKTEFYLECGKGFYVRSLARDIADYLGVCGHVTSLRRTTIGKFTEVDAIKLDYLIELMHNGDWRDTLSKFLYPMHSMLDDILVMYVGDREEDALRKGQKVLVDEITINTCKTVAVCGKLHGNLIAICSLIESHLIPCKVFHLTNK
jgi:tRNA pseudouridine55 synthase